MRGRAVTRSILAEARALKATGLTWEAVGQKLGFKGSVLAVRHSQEKSGVWTPPEGNLTRAEQRRADIAALIPYLGNDIKALASESGYCLRTVYVTLYELGIPTPVVNRPHDAPRYVGWANHALHDLHTQRVQLTSQGDTHDHHP